MDQEVAFLEAREQALPELRHHQQRDHNEYPARRINPARPFDDAGQRGGVDPLQPLDERRLAPLDGRPPQQDEGERRGYGQRDRHGRDYRQRVGDRERPEERTRQPRKQEDRHGGRDDDQGRVDDRTAYFERSIEDYGRDRSVLAAAAILPHSSQDVLDIDDRVVDHSA